MQPISIVIIGPFVFWRNFVKIFNGIIIKETFSSLNNN